MPIYEYQCSSCGHQLEAFQKITDAPLIECPKCHQDTLSKLISATTFQLKGTGWYATDFRDKGKSKPKSEDDQSGSGTNDKANDTSAKETKATEKTKDNKKDSKEKDTKKNGTSTSSNSSAE